MDGLDRILTLAGRDVHVTHPDKPYFSREAKLTKFDLVNYYLAVADSRLHREGGGTVVGVSSLP